MTTTLYRVNDEWHFLGNKRAHTMCGLPIPQAAGIMRIGHDGKRFLPEPPICATCCTKLRPPTDRAKEDSLVGSVADVPVHTVQDPQGKIFTDRFTARELACMVEHGWRVLQNRGPQ